MKLFTAIACALSISAAFIYAAGHQWSLMTWSISTGIWQALYLAEIGDW